MKIFERDRKKLGLENEDDKLPARRPELETVGMFFVFRQPLPFLRDNFMAAAYASIDTANRGPGTRCKLNVEIKMVAANKITVVLVNGHK